MSYNLLADSHAWKYRNELYRGIHDSILSWRRRLRGIVQEVKALRPDVLCLQECEDFHGIAAALAGCGYTGLHAPRAGGRKGLLLPARGRERRHVDQARQHRLGSAWGYPHESREHGTGHA